MTEREELLALFRRLGVGCQDQQPHIWAVCVYFRFDAAGRFEGIDDAGGFHPRIPTLPNPYPYNIGDIVEIKQGETWVRRVVVRAFENGGTRCFWVTGSGQTGVPYFSYDEGKLWRFPGQAVVVTGGAMEFTATPAPQPERPHLRLRFMVAFPAGSTREPAQRELLAMAQKFGPVEADWNGVKMFAFPEDTAEALRVRWDMLWEGFHPAPSPETKPREEAPSPEPPDTPPDTRWHRPWYMVGSCLTQDENRQIVNEALRQRHSGIQQGGHFYPQAPRLSSRCIFGCGAWLGPSRSSAPEGIDQFGACPRQPPPPRQGP